jgi:hypothetical protein
MAWWQRRYIREGETAARGGTYRLDLPDKGLLGSLLVRLDGTQAIDAHLATEKWRMIDYISDVKIIGNGAQVIKGLTGKQLQALAFYDQGVMPDTKWNQYATAVQKEYLLINFGRALFDREIGLDLDAWDNVQLQITNSASSTYYGSDWTASVLGYFLQEGDRFPLGYIKSEEYKAYSATADEWEYTDLPTEGLLRRLILQLEADMGDTYHEAETAMDNLGRDIKITLDSGGVVVYEGGVDDLMRDICLFMGRDVMVRGIVYRTASYHQRNGLGRTFAMASGGLELAADTVIDKPLTWDSDYDRSTWGFANSTGESDQMAVGWGTCPHGQLWIPFTDDMDPNEWIDLAARKTMKVDVHAYNTSGATGGACSIVLERLVR